VSISAGRADESVTGGGSGFPGSVAHVWAPDGSNHGAGFLVAEGVLVTCP